MNSTYQPKRPTLSRFFRRYPYGERRSRAVAPAEGTGIPTIRRRKAASDFTRHRESNAAMRQHHRVRLAVGEFMRKLYVELFLVMIVLFYGIFVVVQMTMDDASLAEYKSIIDVTDITVGSILLIEISLKIFAYGLEYLRNGWSLFDAIVIVASFVLGIVAATGTTSIVLLKILRMRVILRILRVLVVFERLKQRSRAMNLSHRHQITSPVEHVLRLLNELRFHPALKSKTRSDVEFAIDVIKNNRLYDAGEMLEGEGVDDDTQQWLRGEILKVNDDQKALEETGDRSSMAGETIGRTADTGDAAGPEVGDTGEQTLVGKMKRGVTMKELLPALEPASEFELHTLFQNVASWTFDIFRANHVTGGNVLCHLGYHLLHELAATTLNIEQTTLVSFLMEIQRGYIATNPYHNAIHAADVMQTTHYFLTQPEFTPFLRPLDRALALISAGIHDFKHDGFNNSFHISTASEIALRYNDHAVLENYHVAQSFLVMKNPDFNILGQLTGEDFKYSREMIIQMVLATDMAKHFEDVALFKANILPSPGEELAIKNIADKKLVLKMILHTCDVSNPAKERETMLRWTERVVDEFFLQGDMEKRLNLPVSPFMDRETIVIKKMQVGFADFIVAPLFSVWAQILPNVNAVAYKTLLANRDFWFNLSEDFKPHMIKDVVRDLGARKRTSQVGVIQEEPTPNSSSHPMLSRARRSIAHILTAAEELQ
ncbi:hypothetical protein Poli38472_005485 [Pythium oligandrum]|uniref:Phosphodiesterase n=1 Tax=Pythium oligandrum TaxID=41045 RepID=A0A8K1FKI7_PYTOL|nr:hypothetical protein Poli38472_005485 [Pythium oligandrum]|eukprot:TMW62867.1 hypothetical protein Poli38472_005485 [Pythium oligandrum]